MHNSGTDIEAIWSGEYTVVYSMDQRDMQVHTASHWSFTDCRDEWSLEVHLCGANNHCSISSQERVEIRRSLSCPNINVALTSLYLQRTALGYCDNERVYKESQQWDC